MYGQCVDLGDDPHHPAGDELCRDVLHLRKHVNKILYSFLVLKL